MGFVLKICLRNDSLIDVMTFENSCRTKEFKKQDVQGTGRALKVRIMKQTRQKNGNHRLRTFVLASINKAEKTRSQGT
jgi:hypothetical protein